MRKLQMRQQRHWNSAWQRRLASHDSDYGSSKTIAHWMMIKTLAMQVVQLVILEFLPPDSVQDQVIMVACEVNDDTLLEQQLNKPRSPNFQDANEITPLYAAASRGSLKCVLLLLEAGANKDQAATNHGSTPLFTAALHGHLEVVRFLVESGANKDQGRKNDGSTPLHVAAHQGAPWSCPISGWVGCQQRPRHDKPWINALLFMAAGEGRLEVVRFLVEAGANKDQVQTDDGATPLFVAALQGHPWSCPIFGWVGCQQRARPDRDWLNSYFRSS